MERLARWETPLAPRQERHSWRGRSFHFRGIRRVVETMVNTAEAHGPLRHGVLDSAIVFYSLYYWQQLLSCEQITTLAPSSSKKQRKKLGSTIFGGIG